MFIEICFLFCKFSWPSIKSSLSRKKTYFVNDDTKFNKMIDLSSTKYVSYAERMLLMYTDGRYCAEGDVVYRLRLCSTLPCVLCYTSVGTGRLRRHLHYRWEILVSTFFHWRDFLLLVHSFNNLPDEGELTKKLAFVTAICVIYLVSYNDKYKL